MRVRVWGVGCRCEGNGAVSMPQLAAVCYLKVKVAVSTDNTSCACYFTGRHVHILCFGRNVDVYEHVVLAGSERAGCACTPQRNLGQHAYCTQLHRTAKEPWVNMHTAHCNRTLGQGKTAYTSPVALVRMTFLCQYTGPQFKKGRTRVCKHDLPEVPVLHPSIGLVLELDRVSEEEKTAEKGCIRPLIPIMCEGSDK